MSIHATKNAQENAIAAALLIRHLGEPLISAKLITNEQAAAVARAAEHDANVMGTVSARPVAEIIRSVGQHWAEAK